MRDLAARMIADTRAQFEKKRSGFGALRNVRVAKPKSFEARNDKRFDATFADQDILLSKGRVRWGAIVQANTALFEPKAPIAPACVVYADGESGDGTATDLFDFAHFLFTHKGAQDVTDEFLINIKRLLEDELDAPMNMPVPERFGGPKPIYFTTIVVFPEMLPVPFLKYTWFPMLVLPEKTPAAIILPEKFWCPALAELWRNS